MNIKHTWEFGVPRPARGKFPYKGHRTMAEIDAIREKQREYYRSHRKSWRTE